MDAILARAAELKQALIDYVLDAEDDLAIALETFSAEQLTRSQQQNSQKQEFVIDRFLIEGRVGERSPIDLFTAENAKQLSKEDRALLENWHRTFIGLFTVTQILPDGFEMMNWLTAKRYTVKPASSSTLQEMQRFKLGEIVLTQIAPVADDYWMFFGSYTAMGNLGKPKLAVAIGNFKDNYRHALYSDAPDLLEEAWKSVERYHQDFLEFFGSDHVTMSGYELGKKLTEFQEILTRKRLEEAGVDESKSLAEIAEEAGVDESEIAEAAETMGVDAKVVSTMMKNREAAAKMVAPKVELPPDLKKAESVTILADPRWGQAFLPTYARFTQLLEDWQGDEAGERLVRQYLEDPQYGTFVWHRLAEAYPSQLEQVLQQVLQRPDFQTSQDLDDLLKEYGKPLKPELPEIASVPLHLHNLFQDALAEVSKTKAAKEKPKAKKGFQRL